MRARAGCAYPRPTAPTPARSAPASAFKMVVGRCSWGVAVTPGGGRVYVTNHGFSTALVIALASNTVIASIPFGRFPRVWR